MGVTTVETEGIVLRRSIFRESSYIFDLLTPEWGVIPVIARGARREKSPFLGLCEPQQLIGAELVVGRDRYHYLQSGFLLPGTAPNSNYECVLYRSAMSELLLQIQAPDSDWPELYEAFTHAWKQIGETESYPAQTFYAWVGTLFALLGCPPDWQHCAICGRDDVVMSAYDPNSSRMIGREHSGEFPGTIMLDFTEASLLAHLDSIPPVTLDESARQRIVAILLTHLSGQFHTRFVIKSLHSRDLIYREPVPEKR